MQFCRKCCAPAQIQTYAIPIHDYTCWFCRLWMSVKCNANAMWINRIVHPCSRRYCQMPHVYVRKCSGCYFQSSVSEYAFWVVSASLWYDSQNALVYYYVTEMNDTFQSCINVYIVCNLSLNGLLDAHIMKKKIESTPLKSGTLPKGTGCNYRIRSNYRTYPYKHTVKYFVVLRLQPCIFYLLLYRSICCWYSFELPRQVEAIQMSTSNICFIALSRKFKWVPTTYDFIKKIRKKVNTAYHEVHCWYFSKVCPY